MSMNLNCQPNELIVSSFLCVTTVILSLIILGALMLLIFDAFAIVFFRSFAAKMDILKTPPSKPMDDVVLGATESTSNMSFFQFVVEIHKFYDLYPLLAIEKKSMMAVEPFDLDDSKGNGSSGYQKVVNTDDERVQTEEDIDKIKVSSTITLEDKV